MFCACLLSRSWHALYTRPARHISGSPVLQSLLYFNGLFATIYFPINVFLCFYKVIFFERHVRKCCRFTLSLHQPDYLQPTNSSFASLCISAKKMYMFPGPTMSHVSDFLLVQSLSGSGCMRGSAATRAKR